MGTDKHAIALDELAADQDRLHVGWAGAQAEHDDRVTEAFQMRRAHVGDDDVRLLARNEGADLVIEPEYAGPADRSHPGLTVEVLRTERDNQTAVLHDGRADVSYVRLPVDPHRLALQPLFSEPRVAVLPSDHALAGKPAANIADLADEHLLQHPDIVPEWRDIATEMRSRRRTAPPRVIRTVEEKLEHVAAGRGIVILPESTAAYYQRPDLCHVQLIDIPPTQVALAHLSSRRSALIAEFVSIATCTGRELGRPSADRR